jgi:hypothetical protein
MLLFFQFVNPVQTSQPDSTTTYANAWLPPKITFAGQCGGHGGEMLLWCYRMAVILPSAVSSFPIAA